MLYAVFTWRRPSFNLQRKRQNRGRDLPLLGFLRILPGPETRRNSSATKKQRKIVRLISQLLMISAVQLTVLFLATV